MLERQTHPRHQGDLGEADAIRWLTAQGGRISVPLFHSPDYDLIAEFGDALIRVEVKTTTCIENRRFVVRVSTGGGNQSWNGITKEWEARRCEYLFVLTSADRRWFIPSAAVGGGRAIALGGPKYAAYEVGPESGWLLRDGPF
jgi:Holliday junction resolvase-like predicted endonuclease